MFGSATGYVGSTAGGLLPNFFREAHAKKKAAALVLFDEAEKFSKRLLSEKLLHLLAGEPLRDALGEVAAPAHLVIAFTSNLAAESFASQVDDATARETIRRAGTFPPELIGRISRFVPLASEPAVLVHLARKALADMARNLDLDLAVPDRHTEALAAKVADAYSRAGYRGIRIALRDMFLDDLIALTRGKAHAVELIVQQDGAFALVKKSFLRRIACNLLRCGFS